MTFTHDGFTLVGRSAVADALHTLGSGSLLFGALCTIIGVAAFFQGNMGSSEVLVFVMMLVGWAPLFLVNALERRGVDGRTLEVSTGSRRARLGDESCALSELAFVRTGSTLHFNLGDFHCRDVADAIELEEVLTGVVQASATPGNAAPIQQMLAQLGRS